MMQERMRTGAAWVLSLVLLLSVCPLPALAEVPEQPFTDTSIDVTRYSYEVIPILDPFCYYVYVRTDNPDPTSFCLSDKDSKYWSQAGYYGCTPQSVYSIFNRRDGIDKFADVVYEDPASYRVKGGYIFGAPECYPDGGELVVQQRVPDGYIHHNYIDWETNYVDTALTVTCPPVQTIQDALIEQYTDESKSLFENLDAVQAALEQYAVYPRGVGDSDKPNESRPYPFLTTSPYYELGLNEWYSEMFGSGKLLLSAAYPYVLDSLGFPGAISQVAKKLEPSCEVESGYYHWQIVVKYNGQSKSYGGAGQGDSDGVIYTKRVTPDYLFDGSQNDRFTRGTLDSCRDKLLAYTAQAWEDIGEYRDLISGDTFRKTICATGGTWILVGREGGSFDTARDYAYEIPVGENSCSYVSDAWVDGRYVDQWEAYDPGAHFSDHPKADVVVTKMQYTDASGVEHIQDVLFRYHAEEDNWQASPGTYYGSTKDVPSVFTLSRKQVEALGVDAKTDTEPSWGLIYDGTVPPGTPFGQPPVPGKTFRVIYDANGGGGTMKEGTAAEGKAFILPDNGFTAPAGMKFRAWKIDGREYRPGDVITLTGNVTAAAVWEDNPIEPMTICLGDAVVRVGETPPDPASLTWIARWPEKPEGTVTEPPVLRYEHTPDTSRPGQVRILASGAGNDQNRPVEYEAGTLYIVQETLTVGDTDVSAGGYWRGDGGGGLVPGTEENYTVRYEPARHTLTLRNAVISTGRYEETGWPAFQDEGYDMWERTLRVFGIAGGEIETLNLQLEGRSILTVPSISAADFRETDLSDPDDEFNLESTGLLLARTALETSESGDRKLAYTVSAGGTLRVSGTGSLDVNCLPVDWTEVGFAVCLGMDLERLECGGGALRVRAADAVQPAGADENDQWRSAVSFGIQTGTLEVRGGTLTARGGGLTGGSSAGLNIRDEAENALLVSGGRVLCQGGSVGGTYSSSSGLYCMGGITVTGGALEASAGMDCDSDYNNSIVVENVLRKEPVAVRMTGGSLIARGIMTLYCDFLPPKGDYWWRTEPDAAFTASRTGAPGEYGSYLELTCTDPALTPAPAIRSAGRSGSEVTADVSAPGTAWLLCAVYDADGRMTGVRRRSVEAGTGSETFSFPGTDFARARLFLLDGYDTPLTGCREVK